MKKVFLSLMLAMGLFASSGTQVYAESGSIPTRPAEKVTAVENVKAEGSTIIDSSTGMKSSKSIYDPSTGQMGESISLEEATEKWTDKGFAIADAARLIAVPAIEVIFVISAIWTVIGLFTRKGIWPGVWGMIISSLAFALVKYAPQIMSFIASTFTL